MKRKTTRGRGIIAVLSLLLTIPFAAGAAGEAPENLPAKRPLRFALGAMLVPSEGYTHYRDLMGYVENRVRRTIKIVDRESYAEINDLLKAGNLDAAFVCSGPYVDGHDDFGLELLVVPFAYGQPAYHSYIIVHKDSPLSSFEDLRGKSFAFTDPQSNTGRLVPGHLLAQRSETPESFFAKHTYTYAHDKSILAVAQKVADGAAVDSLIWDYADRTDPRYTSQTKIIWKSQPFGIPPVVVRKDLDDGVKKALREVFLAMDEDDEGRKILDAVMIDRFEVGDDSRYDSIREMKHFTPAEAGGDN